MRDITDDDLATRWLPWNRTAPSADPAGRLRVYCLPHAGGGGVVYLPWLRQQHPAGLDIVPVELPGRGPRLAEEPFTDMNELVTALVDELFGTLSPEPFALFGHSMGAYVAYEVALRLAEQQGPEPVHLFVSGCRPPGAPPAERLDDLRDAALIESLSDMGGTPPEVLRRQDLMELILPVLRADYTLLERYYDMSRPLPLSCPITVFGGDDDPLAGPEWLAAWRDITTDRFSVHTFPGGHFYLQDRPADVLRALAESVATAGTSATGRR